MARDMLRGVFRDSLGNEITVDFTRNLDWKDWRYLEIPLPEQTYFPIIWKCLYIVESDPRKHNKGSCQFHQFRAIYPPRRPRLEINTLSLSHLPDWLKFDTAPIAQAKSRTRFFAFGESLISKSEPRGTGSMVLNKVIEGINKRGGDFALSTGNLTSSGGAENLEIVKNKLAHLKCKCYTALGNVEIKGDPEVLNYPMIMAPTHYVVNRGLVSVFVLDNSRGGFKASDSHQKPIETQWQWLLKALEETRANVLVFLCHFPPISEPDVTSESMNVYEAQTLHRLALREARKGRRVLVIAGDIPVFQVRVKDEIPYFITGGAGATISRSPVEGGFYHYVEFNVSKKDVTFAVRPIFSRLAVKWKPPKPQVGVGEQLAFEGSGVFTNPAQRKKLIVPLADPISFEWRVSDRKIARIDPRTGILPGMVSVILDTGDSIDYEGITIVSPN